MYKITPGIKKKKIKYYLVNIQFNKNLYHRPRCPQVFRKVPSWAPLVTGNRAFQQNLSSTLGKKKKNQIRKRHSTQLLLVACDVWFWVCTSIDLFNPSLMPARPSGGVYTVQTLLLIFRPWALSQKVLEPFNRTSSVGPAIVFGYRQLFQSSHWSYYHFRLWWAGLDGLRPLSSS